MVDTLANIKRLESLIACDGTVIDRIAHATEEFKKVCRTCLRETTANSLDNYFLPNNDTTMSLVTIREILEAATGVKVETIDCLPNHICNECLKKIKTIYKFRQQSQQIDEALKGFLVNIEIDAPIVEPPSSSVIADKVDDQTDSVIQIDQYEVTYVDEASDETTEVEPPKQCTPTGKKKLFRCGICKREYTFRNGLHDHIRSAHVQEKDKHCQTCGRKFRTMGRLLMHKKRNCSKATTVTLEPVEKEPWQSQVTIKDEVIEIKNFQCSICDEAIELEKDFLAHLQTHWNEKTCKYCKKKVSRPSYLESHVRSHSNIKPYVCPLCSRGFTATQSLRYHLKTYSKRLAQTCKICGTMFCSLADYLKHYHSHFVNGVVGPEVSKQSDVGSACEGSSKDAESINSSEAVNEGVEQYSVTFVKQEQVHEEPVTIKKENEHEEDVIIVNEPLSEDDPDQEPTPILETVEFKAEPEDTSVTFRESSENSRHLTPTEDDQGVDKPSDEEEEEEEDSQDAASSAKRKGDDESLMFGSFACPDSTCKMQFKYCRDVIRHYTSTHCVYPPFTCTVCKEILMTKAELRVHMKQHIKCAFVCRYCPRQYWILRDLKNHLRTHTGERPFQCSLCPQRFKQRPALRVHIQTHNTTKEYKCKYCDKEFFSYNGMFLHQKSHIKIEELQCKACNKQFPTQSRLKRHLTSVCGLIIPTLGADKGPD